MGNRKENAPYPRRFLCEKSPCSLTFQRAHVLHLLAQAWGFPSQYVTLADPVWQALMPGSSSSIHWALFQVMVLIGWELESVVWPPGERIWLWIILSLFTGSAFHLHTSLFIYFFLEKATLLSINLPACILASPFFVLFFSDCYNIYLV